MSIPEGAPDRRVPARVAFGGARCLTVQYP